MAEIDDKPRTALRGALWAGLAGGFGTGGYALKGILAASGPDAVASYVLLPFVFISAAVFFGIWGLALGTVIAHVRGTRPAMRPVLIMAWVVSIAVPAAIAWELVGGFSRPVLHGTP
jgi:hypothetical protein